MDLMLTNAKGKHIRDKDILVYGSCVAAEHLDVLDKFSKHTQLSFCPEQEHINMAFYKLIAMMSVARSLTVLTVDGSPHCVQLHYIADELKRYSKQDFNVEHFVIYNGKLVQISEKEVKISRYLAKIKAIQK